MDAAAIHDDVGMRIHRRAPFKSLVRLASCGHRRSRAPHGQFRGTRASQGPVATRHSSPTLLPITAESPPARPADHGPTCFSCVTATVNHTEQLVGQLRLVSRRVRAMKDQPAIPDDVSRALPLHRQNPRPRTLTLCAHLRSDVLHGRSTLGIYPPMRRNPRSPLSSQLAIDGGLAHSATPKDGAIGLQSVQNERRRHAGIISWGVLNSAT